MTCFLSGKFASTRFVSRKFANARSTKGFVGFFAVHERLPTSATLGLRSLNYLCSTISDFWTFQLQFLHFCSKFLVISFHSKQIQSITKRFFSWKTDLFKNSDVISLWFDFKSSWPSSITFVSDPRKSINHLFTIIWEGEGSGLFRTFRDFWTGPTPCTRTKTEIFSNSKSKKAEERDAKQRRTMNPTQFLYDWSPNFFCVFSHGNFDFLHVSDFHE